MRFGLFGGAVRAHDGRLGDSQGYRRYIDYVIEAEALGYYGVYLVEHHFTGFGQVSASLNLLTYLAARTSTIRLGTAVIVVPWHNPVLLAEQAATVDLLSDGRLDFGVGRGYRFTEYHGFGLTPDELRERFDEAMSVIRTAWTTEGRFSHHGKYWTFEDVVVEPRPLQEPHPPIWIGAAGADSIRQAAEQGYKLFLDQVASFETIAERAALYRDTKTARGEPFSPNDIAVARTIHFAANQAEREAHYAKRAAAFQRLNEVSLSPAARAGANDVTTRLSPPGGADPRRAAEDAAIIGNPDECIERIRRLEAAGIGQVMLIDFEGSLDTLRTFAREVMPAFAQSD